MMPKGVLQDRSMNGFDHYVSDSLILYIEQMRRENAWMHRTV
jgi:hypothetical protein